MLYFQLIPGLRIKMFVEDSQERMKLLIKARTLSSNIPFGILLFQNNEKRVYISKTTLLWDTEFPWALGYLVTHNQIPGFVGLFWRQKFHSPSSRCSSSPSGFASLLFISASPLCSLFRRPPCSIQNAGLTPNQDNGIKSRHSCSRIQLTHCESK